MEYYSSLYFLTICSTIALGGIIFWKQKNISWYYFLLFSIFLSLWFFGYFLFFSRLFTDTILLFISRITFLFGVVGSYSLLFFVVFFWLKKPVYRHYSLPLLFYTVLAVLYVGTPWIVKSLDFDPTLGVYREHTGVLFPLHVLLYFFFLIAFWVFAYKWVRKLRGLSRVRLEHILLATIIFVVLLLVLQLVLPLLFNIWILENEIIFFFFIYITYIAFVLRRYFFHPIGYGIRRFITFLTALIWSIVLYDLTKFFLGKTLITEYSYLDASFIIIFFLITFWWLSRLFFRRDIDEDFRESIFRIQNTLISRNSFPEFEKTLKTAFHKEFNIHHVSIVRFLSENNEWAHFQEYFNNKKNPPFYLNDIVFREEKRKKVSLDALSKDVTLIIPISDTTGCFALLELWGKSLWDFYTKKEIRILTSFSYFLAAHIRYIDAYSELTDISRELDRRVDEKTIEYNNLISKQKELINIISHEVRSPLGSAIFQADSVMDDLSHTKKDEAIRKELKLLVDQLLVTSDIINKIFSIQYLDTASISLFRTDVDLSGWLWELIAIQSRMHEEVDFSAELDPVGYISLDKVQFSQVFSNILANALKFAHKEHPKIIVILRKTHEGISLHFHDNGDGFAEDEVDKIFDKFYRGTSSPVGLGMGLYLCKKIVEMHGGSISAHSSGLLSGGHIEITLPTT